MRGRIRTCPECPAWSKGWCSAFAKIAVAMAPSCGYGRKLMQRRYMREYMRSYGKRKDKE